MKLKHNIKASKKEDREEGVINLRIRKKLLEYY